MALGNNPQGVARKAMILNKRKRKLTWTDLLQVYQPVLFTFRMQGLNSSLWYLNQWKKMKDPTWLKWHHFREDFFQTFKLYIPDLTYRDAEQIWKDAHYKRACRQNQKYWRKEHDKNLRLVREFNNNRLYPLRESYYDELAKHIYEKYGSPKFGKKKIHGVKFGKPFSEWSQYHGQNSQILKRMVGIIPTDGKFHMEIHS